MSFFKNLFKKKEEPQAVPKEAVKKALKEVAAVMNGDVKPITESPDPVFAQKMMGDGYVIIPSDGKVIAPFDGKVATAFPTKHAVGLVSNDGVELLIHIGLDTVSLNGEGFKIFVKADDTVKKGDTLLQVDLDFIKSKGLQTATPVVVTNLSDDQTMELKKTGNVTAGETVLVIK
ncbi:MAG: PTS glucose transporter subunit IIA [Clostridiaceae bacterium]